MDLSTNLISPPEGVTFWIATTESLHDLWMKIKDFDRLFTDNVRWDEASFNERMLSHRSIVLETINGVIIGDILEENHLGRAHFIFWDKKLSIRTELLRNCLEWFFLVCNLNVVEVQIPDYARALRRFIERKLKFKYEGRLRSRMYYKGELTDALIYSMLKEEVLDVDKTGS